MEIFLAQINSLDALVFTFQTIMLHILHAISQCAVKGEKTFFSILAPVCPVGFGVGCEIEMPAHKSIKMKYGAGVV
jgi:hypothetical protein